MRNHPADTKVKEEQEGGGTSGARAEISEAHGEDHSEAGCPLAAHGGPRYNRYPPVGCGRPYTREGGYALKEVAAWGELVIEKVYLERLPPMVRTRAGAGKV